MSGDIPSENIKNSEATDNSMAEDLSRAAMAQVPGLVSAAPLTPSDWKEPGTVDAAKTTSEIVVSMLPVPGLQEMGVFGKLVEGSVSLYRRVTGAMNLTNELGTKTDAVAPLDVIPLKIEPPVVRGGQSNDTISNLVQGMRRAVTQDSDTELPNPLRINSNDASNNGTTQEILPREIDPYEDAQIGSQLSRITQKLDEVRKYALEMGQLQYKPDIMDYVEGQAIAKGPAGIKNMENTIAADGIKPDTAKFWQQEIGEFKIPANRIAQLQDKDKILEFARFYASKRPIEARNLITAARENGWIQHGTEEAWGEALARMPK